jgi:hypothetical protein
VRLKQEARRLRELANEAPKLNRGVHITNLGSMRGVPAPLSARGIQLPRNSHGIPAHSFDTAEHAITAANAPAGTSLAELDEILANLEVARSPEEVLAVRFDIACPLMVEMMRQSLCVWMCTRVCWFLISSVA